MRSKHLRFKRILYNRHWVGRINKLSHNYNMRRWVHVRRIVVAVMRGTSLLCCSTSGLRPRWTIRWRITTAAHWMNVPFELSTGGNFRTLTYMYITTTSIFVMYLICKRMCILSFNSLLLNIGRRKRFRRFHAGQTGWYKAFLLSFPYVHINLIWNLPLPGHNNSHTLSFECNFISIL